MAAPVFQTSAHAEGLCNTTIACNAPASAANGDLLVAAFASGSLVTHSASGWTSIRSDSFNGGNNRASLWWRTHDGSASYNFTTSVASFVTLDIGRITGAHATPIDAQDKADSATAPSITTTVADTLLLAFVSTANDGDGLWSPPANYTERWDAGTTSGGINHAMASKDQAAIGASGTAAFSGSPSGTPVAQHVAIAPALDVGGIASRRMMKGIGA